MAVTLDLQQTGRGNGSTQDLDGFSGSHGGAVRFGHAAQSNTRKSSMPESLVYQAVAMPEKLARMASIHAQIKALRMARGWSHKKLAEEVSQLEGLAKPLAWTTVQQWEQEGGTAPKRKRLEYVAEALGTTVGALLSEQRQEVMAGEPAPAPYYQLPQALEQVVRAVAALTPSAWAMVRGALDAVVGHPEMQDDVTANVLMVLQAPPGKRHNAA